MDEDEEGGEEGEKNYRKKGERLEKSRLIEETHERAR